MGLAKSTSLCGYEQEDYSARECRFRDDPVQEDYHKGAVVLRVLGGVVIIGTVTVAAGTFTIGTGGSGAVMLATVFGGGVAVGGVAVMDLVNGRVGSVDAYLRAALNGSIIGAMTGAIGQLPLYRLGPLTRGLTEFALGAVESGMEQELWEEEIDFKEAVGYGILAVVTWGVLEKWPSLGKSKIGEGEFKTSYGKSSSNCTELVPYYPANNGAVPGTEKKIYLMAGDKIDRFGGKKENSFHPQEHLWK